jgi:hypothetical protein
VRESQSRQLESQFSDLKNSLVIYTRGSTAIGAVEAFTSAFNDLNNATIDAAQQQSIVDYYTNQVVKPTEQNTGTDVDVLLPTSNAQKYLQGYYPSGELMSRLLPPPWAATSTARRSG